MPYADLVLEGGGVKGIGLVGAISVLQERGYEFKRVAGTSAGAIIGSLVAAGIAAPELEKIMRTVNYCDFQDGGFIEKLIVGKAFDLVFRHGIHPGTYLQEWLGQRLEEVGVSTFADLHYQDAERPLPPEKQYRLVVMASDISQGRLRRLPWDYHDYGRNPELQRVAQAVRASMSLPFFYTPVIWDTADGKKSWLVDGGMLSNFPIDAFDAPTGLEPRWPTIGIKLSADPAAALRPSYDIHSTVSMSVAMIQTMTGFYDRMHIEESDAVDRTIFVDAGDVQTTDFGVTREKQDQLFQSGRKAALKFLDGGNGRPAWDFDAYVARHRAPLSLVPAAHT